MALNSDVLERIVAAYSAGVKRIGDRSGALGMSLWDTARPEKLLDLSIKTLVPLWGEGYELGLAFYRVLKLLDMGYTVRHDESRRRPMRMVTAGDVIGEFEKLSGVELGDLGVDRSRRVKEYGIVSSSPVGWKSSDFWYLKQSMDKQQEHVAAKGAMDYDRVAFGAAAQKVAADGARTTVAHLGESDGNCLGFARYSTTGTPCAFCALLLTRGMAYKSSKSAVLSARGNSFHPNCKCVSVPVFHERSWKAGNVFALNRKFEREYRANDTVSAATGIGKLRAWRSYYWKTYRK